MTYTIICAGKYVFAYREPTQTERVCYIRNGYEPPNLIGEYNRPAYQYVRGETKPNYPMPALYSQSDLIELLRQFFQRVQL